LRRGEMPNSKANHIYKLLVPVRDGRAEGEEYTRDDFVGFIAYALYKHNKVKWIEKYKRDHPDLPDGWVPEEETLKWQEDEKIHIKDYQEIAENRFRKIMESYLKDRIDSFKYDYKKKADQEFKTAEQEFKTNFIEGKIKDTVKLAVDEYKPSGFLEKHIPPVIHSLIGAIVFALLGIIFLLWWLGADFLDGIQKTLEAFKSAPPSG
jgi:hypothetical protein